MGTSNLFVEILIFIVLRSTFARRAKVLRRTMYSSTVSVRHAVIQGNGLASPWTSKDSHVYDRSAHPLLPPRGCTAAPALTSWPALFKMGFEKSI